MFVYISAHFTYKCDVHIIIIVTQCVDCRYVAVVIIPLRIHVPRDDAEGVKIICGYVRETAYPVI